VFELLYGGGEPPAAESAVNECVTVKSKLQLMCVHYGELDLAGGSTLSSTRSDNAVLQHQFHNNRFLLHTEHVINGHN
jgi:hypothetical protein